MLVTTIVALSITVVTLYREVRPLRDEVRQLRNEVGRLSIEDPTKLHAIQVETDRIVHAVVRCLPKGRNHAPPCVSEGEQLDERRRSRRGLLDLARAQLRNGSLSKNRRQSLRGGATGMLLGSSQDRAGERGMDHENGCGRSCCVVARRGNSGRARARNSRPGASSMWNDRAWILGDLLCGARATTLSESTAGTGSSCSSAHCPSRAAQRRRKMRSKTLLFACLA